MQREPPATAEGWYALHDVRRIDWDAWRAADESARRRAVAQAIAHLDRVLDVEDADDGASAVYTVIGHKGDLMFVHLRPSLAALDRIERQFEQTAFADLTERQTSFLSVTEASGYSEKGREFVEGEVDEDAGIAQYMRSRLYPAVPDEEFVCFYPMSKRREPDQNWYDLPFEERAEHIERHGNIGREYGGRVQQMITGAIGFDDWEWGVTLWTADMTDVKELLSEMRFDPSTSRFAEFGPFYVGRRFPPTDLPAVLAGEAVPTGEDGPQVDVSVAAPEVESLEDLEADVGGGPAASAIEDAAEAEGSGAGAADGVASDSAGESDEEQVLPIDEEAGGATADGADGHAHGSDDGGGHPHASQDDGGDAPADHPHASEDESGDADEATDEDDGGHPGGGGGGRPDVGDPDYAEVEDMPRRLASFGLYEGQDYEADHFALLYHSDAEASELGDAAGDLRESFEHYDRHVLTSTRAQGGEAAVVSIWTAKEAADTAAGFLGDLPGISERCGGPLGGGPDAGGGQDGGAPGAADGDASGTGDGATGSGGGAAAGAPDGPAASIRDELSDLDVYAGQPHGEDVYALVLYSEAEDEELEDAVAEFRATHGDRADHVETSLYDAQDGDVTAVVSLWADAVTADEAAEALANVPGVLARDEDEGFSTMGMFYRVEPEHREDFVETFAAVGEKLEGMDGHRETALLIDREDENDMFIASRWDAREDAMAFFRSDDFAETVEWGRDVLADRPRHVFLA